MVLHEELGISSSASALPAYLLCVSSAHSLTVIKMVKVWSESEECCHHRLRQLHQDLACFLSATSMS